MSGSYSSEQKSILTEEQLHGISKYWKVYLCYPFFFFHNLWATSETASGILTNRPLAILLGCITVKTTYLGWHWALHTCKLLDSWVLVFSTRGHHHTHQLCLQTGMQRSLENAVLHTSIFLILPTNPLWVYSDQQLHTWNNIPSGHTMTVII